MPLSRRDAAIIRTRLSREYSMNQDAATAIEALLQSVDRVLVRWHIRENIVPHQMPTRRQRLFSLSKCVGPHVSANGRTLFPPTAWAAPRSSRTTVAFTGSSDRMIERSERATQTAPVQRIVTHRIRRLRANTPCREKCAEASQQTLRIQRQ